MTNDAPLDLAAYLRRIRWRGTARADAATLRGVHRAHTYALPFENLDPVRGTVPSLALGDLAAKMLEGGRGGYCYEQNTLLAAALRALGLHVTLLTARVAVGTDDVAARPRTHMALHVEVPGEGLPYLADVGFGATGALIEPIPLAEGPEHEAGGRRHRLVHVPHQGPLPLWLLQAHGQDGWADQYVFTLEPFEHSDVEVANWYVATSERSPFRRRLYVQQAAPGGEHRALAGRELTLTRGHATVERRTVPAEEIPGVLREEFGLDAPDGMHFPE